MNFPRLITFTKAREKSDLWENGEQRNENLSRNSKVNISGEEARTFYESLLSIKEEQRKKPSRKRKRAALSSHERTHDRPSHDRPSQGRPDHDRPSQDRPDHDRPSQDRPDHDRPSQDRPDHDRPSQDRPDHDRPSQDRPYQDRPSHDRPFQDRPSHDRPFQDRPDHDRPSQDRPAHDRPSQDRPSHDRPSQDRPSHDRPSQDRPSHDRPSQDRPSHDRPSQDRPSQDRPPMAARGATDERIGYQLLKCSQLGDLKGVKCLLEKENCDINFQDSYFWTAMMSAAYAGRKDVVSYLLKRGAAWVGVCETKGKDAVTLAEEAGHQDVVQLLQDSLRSHPQELPPRAHPPERKYCDVCKTHYQEDSVETHERSTVHLFNKKKKLPPTYYVIPEHNIGYKMMLKEGWDSEAGLGPSGAGRKFPVQTILKRDLKGLGFQSKEKPKVTHFAPNDLTAVARPAITHKRTERVATVSRKEEKRKEAKAKAWERDLRTYMNIDL